MFNCNASLLTICSTVLLKVMLLSKFKKIIVIFSGFLFSGGYICVPVVYSLLHCNFSETVTVLLFKNI